jgi:hypothetical protein
MGDLGNKMLIVDNVVLSTMPNLSLVFSSWGPLKLGAKFKRGTYARRKRGVLLETLRISFFFFFPSDEILNFVWWHLLTITA